MPPLMRLRAVAATPYSIGGQGWAVGTASGVVPTRRCP